MKVARIAAAAAIMMASAVTAQAQVVVSGLTTNCTGSLTALGAGCTVTNTVTNEIPFVARMTLSSATTELTRPVASQFNTAAGVLTNNILTLEVSSNSKYSITAAAGNGFFTGGAGTKPASDLTYTVDNGATAYKVLAGAGSTLGSELAATATTTYTIGFKTLYNWVRDVPGTYELAINYTLTAP